MHSHLAEIQKKPLISKKIGWISAELKKYTSFQSSQSYSNQIKFSQALKNLYKNIFDPKNIRILDTRIHLILLSGTCVKTVVAFKVYFHNVSFPQIQI